MKKYLYLLVAVVCMGFVACSSDDDDNQSEKKEDKNQEQEKESTENADIIGWWVSDWLWSTASPNVCCHAIHIVNCNVIESTYLVKTVSSYNSEYSTEDVGDYVFTYHSTDYYYSKQNSVYTYVYKRNGNIIARQRSGNDDDYIIIMNGKLKWGEIEYTKATSE